MKIPDKMRAMVMEAAGEPLRLQEVPVPRPETNQVLIQIEACGVCRTDLHILDGDLPNPKLPLILGHEIVGKVVKTGAHVNRYDIGERVGVPWLSYTDGTCRYCLRGQENLCDHPLFTGYTIDGGYAEYTLADQRYVFPLQDTFYSAVEAAPLLCAGFIGYRSYRLAGDHIERLGIYGFGGAGHIIAQIAERQGIHVYAFTRPGDKTSQEFARQLGAVWAGDSTELPPDELDAAIIFAPVGSLVVEALKATSKGGTIVCGGIHMNDIPSFPYHLLWEERIIRSVANLTRQDGEELLMIAPKVPVKTQVHTFALEAANEALEGLREGKFEGAAVLDINPS